LRQHIRNTRIIEENVMKRLKNALPRGLILGGLVLGGLMLAVLPHGDVIGQEATAHTVKVESFSPQGEVKQVRQAQARFSAPMVAFGDPRLESPFDVQCEAKGQGRWADANHWIYDFEADLPAGHKCSFTLKRGLKSLADGLVNQASFTFTTGGPAIMTSQPAEGSEYIDEAQVFLLGLDAPANLASIKAHASCSIEGLGERISLKLIEGAERERILAEQSGQARHFFEVLTKRGQQGLLSVKDKRLQQTTIIVAQCDRKFPAGSKVSLHWGKGISTVNGIATSEAQTLGFYVREAFSVESSCTRMNPKAGCVPVLPVTLQFTAPVARDDAEKIRIRTADGKQISPTFPKEDRSPTVDTVSFSGPFPSQTEVVITLPKALVDDSGRNLLNASSFPLKLQMDEDPPLIKFPSRFGILERHAQPMLPVSVRNVEATLKGVQAQLSAQPNQPNAAAASKGVLARLEASDDTQLARWIQRATRGPYDNKLDLQAFQRQHNRYPREGEMPLLMGNASDASDFQATPLHLPAATGKKPLELIGIPLPKPGFYVVEFASDRLGSKLHDAHKPYYVSSSALVTNMAVHFKKGRESSLVWVTRLDNAQAVSQAAVRVSTCDGRMLWEGETDANGIANISEELADGYFDHCYGMLVTARKQDDLSFVLSSWNDGISPWQFNLGGGSEASPTITHTVFDRPLFRAGEQVSMKHFVRVRTGDGFNLASNLPAKATIAHEGSGQTFDIPIQWSASAGVSTWAIPKEAKLGTYSVSFITGHGVMRSGTFRVEQYRVPLMKAILKPPAQPLVNGKHLEIDAQLNLLAGGAAAGAPVKFRSRLVRYPLQFPLYDDFYFGGSVPKEGIETVEPYAYDPEDGMAQTLEDGQTAYGDKASGYAARTVNMVLDADGGARVRFDQLPKVQESRALEVEMEYADPNGQILTAATRALVLPSATALGMKIEGYFATKERMAFKVIALDATGHVLKGRKVVVDAYARKTYAYRKRLLGGFYAYEQTAEVKRLGSVCTGSTDAQGIVICNGAAPETGELILVARAKDDQGNPAIASQTLYVAGEDSWFSASQSDRIDVLADKRSYAPGDKARFEVRMPFREATALVTVEREGILKSMVLPITAKSPFIDLPIAESYGPNAYVSVMVVRGRIQPEVSGAFSWLKRMMYRVGMLLGIVETMPREMDTRPTALVDLTKPAFKLGITPIRVGWEGYELKVKVEPERDVYKVRDKALVTVTVTDAAGKPASNAEIALAAVDEGLLQLSSPTSWNLLEAMMERRPIEVHTSTAQSQVIGKRHFGKKAVAPGGGGGQGANARELFDTLLLWKPSIQLDEKGQASVEVPLNDSLTSFRIAAIAHAGATRFGTATAMIRSTQEVMLFSGLPPFVREGDQFSAMVTLRNGGTRPLTLDVSARYQNGKETHTVGTQRISMQAGEGSTVTFPTTVPYDAKQLDWQISAQEVNQPINVKPAHDALKLTQQVGAAYPVRVYQQTMEQLVSGKPWIFSVQRPNGAIADRGGVDIRLASSLGGDMSAIREWMTRYPYTCIEQRVSVAVALEDAQRWQQVMNSLSLHLDGDGLVKYFPVDWLQGDDTLTAYVLSIADEADYEIPEASRERMLKGLEDFVTGRIQRYGRVQTADVVMRKLTAIDALSRYARATPSMLEPLQITPNLWPSSGVIDWVSILTRMQDIPQRTEKRAQALEILRSRMSFSGTTMRFSTEKQDYLWWLMVSPDLNAVRALRLLTDDPSFSAADAGRLARGALARQAEGRWQTTLANAWGVVALRHFQQRYEKEPVSGSTTVALDKLQKSLSWVNAKANQSGDPTLGTPLGAGLHAHFSWPTAAAPLSLQHEGGGKPWAFVTSSAALPLKKPLFAGYSIQRTVTPVEQKVAGVWQRGDTYRVTLDIDAQADMTWVVIHDPAPAGASVLGSGLGGDSAQLVAGEKQMGWQRPAFEERAFDGYRAYYAYVPKGKFSVEYTVRLNNPGLFEMPATRVEAMYAPEIFGELPVAKMDIKAQ
jgi:alpha-2-macroglobulin